MEYTKNSEAFSDEELEKAIEKYNLYIANKEAFKKVYNEGCKYDENKSFLENAKDLIYLFTARAKIEATIPDATKLSSYVFEKAVCSILKDRKIGITEIKYLPTYGEDSPEFFVKIQNEKSDTIGVLLLDCEALRIGGGIIEKETSNKLTVKKIFIKEHPSFENWGDYENVVYSKNKFDGILSLQKLKEEIIPQIKEDCEILIKAFLKNLEEEAEDNKDSED